MVVFAVAVVLLVLSDRGCGGLEVLLSPCLRATLTYDTVVEIRRVVSACALVVLAVVETRGLFLRDRLVQLGAAGETFALASTCFVDFLFLSFACLPLLGVSVTPIVRIAS